VFDLVVTIPDWFSDQLHRPGPVLVFLPPSIGLRWTHWPAAKIPFYYLTQAQRQQVEFDFSLFLDFGLFLLLLISACASEWRLRFSLFLPPISFGSVFGFLLGAVTVCRLVRFPIGFLCRPRPCYNIEFPRSWARTGNCLGVGSASSGTSQAQSLALVFSPSEFVSVVLFLLVSCSVPTVFDSKLMFLPRPARPMEEGSYPCVGCFSLCAASFILARRPVVLRFVLYDFVMRSSRCLARIWLLQGEVGVILELLD
jgi:hypothetical protein